MKSKRPYSAYLESVKKPGQPVYEMNLSGTTPPTPVIGGTLPFEVEESRRSKYFRVVMKQLSELTGTAESRLMLSVGSSSGLLHVLSALTKTGDTIVIEKPFYEPFVMAAKYLGLKIEFFSRSGDFARDLVELRRARRKSSLLLISNPSSPAGWLYSSAEIKRIASLFDHVVVDEIFLPVFANEVSRTGTLSNVVSVSGLSKTLGLSSLRVGWIKASPTLLRACDQMALNTYVDVPTLPLVGASLVLPRWSELVGSHRARAEANRGALREFALRHPNVLSHDFSLGHFGTMKVPRRSGTAKKFVAALKKKSIYVCDCTPFGQPNHIRFSAILEPAKFRRALTEIEAFYL